MRRNMKRIRIPSEIAYVFSIMILSMSVAMAAAADYGVSMIVAPAYILSLKIDVITFGQAEYIIQGILFIIFILLMGKVKAVYFTSFLTGIFYGAMLDLWRIIVPSFNPEITAPGSLPAGVNIVYFLISMVVTSFSIALLFHNYLYPQVYDFFVKGISVRYNLDRGKFKIAFDFACLIISCVMTLALFGRFVGIGIGTIVLTCFNGLIIKFFDSALTKYCEFTPIFKKLSKYFDII